MASPSLNNHNTSRDVYGMNLLASTLAHEIRNPLQIIRLQLEQLEKNGASHSVLQVISKNLTRLEHVVDRIQKLDQCDHFHPETFDLREMVDTALTSVGFWLSASGIKVVLGVKWEGVPRVEGDKELLEQVFFNLLMNAIQAMPQGGTLTIHVLESLEFASLEVKDTGIGMEPQLLKMVGTPFFTTKTNGNGLGLAFCKTVAALHHGDVEIESTRGQGTTIHFRVRKRLLTKLEKDNESMAENSYRG